MPDYPPDTPRHVVMEPLQDAIEDLVSWNVKEDRESIFAPILLRQRIIDHMTQLDGVFGSTLSYRYTPMVIADTAQAGIEAIAFCDYNDGDWDPMDVDDIEPFEDDLYPEVPLLHWPPQNIATEAHPHNRRMRGSSRCPN